MCKAWNNYRKQGTDNKDKFMRGQMIFFHYKEKNNFKGMFEHRLPGFTILDLGCPLSKDGPAIQENKVKFFK